MTKDSLVLEIRQSPIAAVHHRHPLAEISRSPGHFLLLKLWQRDEHLSAQRLSSTESRRGSISGEIVHLCCLFSLFHGLFFAILSASPPDAGRCREWWIPSALSLCTSLAVAVLVQARLRAYWAADRALQKGRSEGRALSRSVQELRMKGASFDLSKGPQGGGKKLKSSSVEVKWRPLEWCSRFRVTVVLIFCGGLVLPPCRFILCA